MNEAQVGTSGTIAGAVVVGARWFVRSIEEPEFHEIGEDYILSRVPRKLPIRVGERSATRGWSQLGLRGVLEMGETVRVAFQGSAQVVLSLRQTSWLAWRVGRRLRAAVVGMKSPPETNLRVHLVHSRWQSLFRPMVSAAWAVCVDCEENEKIADPDAAIKPSK